MCEVGYFKINCVTAPDILYCTFIGNISQASCLFSKDKQKSRSITFPVPSCYYNT